MVLKHSINHYPEPYTLALCCFGPLYFRPIIADNNRLCPPTPNNEKKVFHLTTLIIALKKYYALLRSQNNVYYKSLPEICLTVHDNKAQSSPRFV